MTGPGRPGDGEAGPALGARVMALVDQLARHTDEPGRLTRLYLSPAHRAAADAVAGLMRDAGLTVRLDAAGTVIGRLEAGEAGAPALLVGSHIDSVVDAGRYDGTLGVVCGIVAAEALAREGARLPFALEVAAFGDEENVRFPTSLSTSAALAGRYDPAWLDRSDAGGVTLRDALLAFGGDPDGIAAAARRPGDLLGYLEVHIEQGPVLEAENLAVGIVSAINGLFRARARVVGEAGHAGTVPMGLRKDALAAAAEMIGAVERAGAARPGAVATVGQVTATPGAVNVIPGEAWFTIDARAPEDAVRRLLVGDIATACRAVAARREVAFSWAPFMDTPATPMDSRLMAALEAAAKRLGVPSRRLPSGAGHDAVAMATLCPAAMLFVRCRGGISHNPLEAVAERDADTAVRVLVETIRGLAAEHASTRSWPA